MMRCYKLRFGPSCPLHLGATFAALRTRKLADYWETSKIPRKEGYLNISRTGTLSRYKGHERLLLVLGTWVEMQNDKF